MSSIEKIALVTGAGSGIGRRTALALLHEGYAVVLAGRHAESLEKTAAEAGPKAARALVTSADVTDPASVQALFENAVTLSGATRTGRSFSYSGIITFLENQQATLTMASGNVYNIQW